MREAVTDAQQRPGFPLRSFCSLQDGNENRGQLFALLSQLLSRLYRLCRERSLFRFSAISPSSNFMRDRR